MAVQKQKTTTKAKAVTKTRGAVVKRAATIRKEILACLKAVDENYLKMSELMYDTYHKDLFVDWGFETFADYIAEELDLEIRKAQYFINIWDKVKEFNLPKAEVAKLGWTKMKDIASVINEKNAKKLMANAKKMSTREFTESIKQMRRKDLKGKAPVITTMTIRLGEDEAKIINDALSEAKKLVESQNDTVALSMICQDWLEERGAVPELRDIKTHVNYIQKIYGVKVTTTKQTAADKAKLKKAQEASKKRAVKAEADKKATARKKTTAKKGAPRGKKKEEPAEQNIDDLLGI